MELQSTRQAALAYFYFDLNNNKKTNLKDALHSLLTQLTIGSDIYCDLLFDIYNNNHRYTHCTDKMIGCLESMLKQPDQGSIYIILDVLDECSETGDIPSACIQVLDILKHLVNAQLSNLHLRVTS